MYQIKLDQFEGPLDLLLKLIEEKKMDITRVSLAQVTDQFLEHLSQRENIHLTNLAEFLTIASKLILIKSKALLPNLELSQEEENEIKDLEQKLEIYRRYKEAAGRLGKILNKGQRRYSRNYVSINRVLFYPPQGVAVYDLARGYQKILSEIVPFEKLEEEMVREVVSLEEKISEIQKILSKKIEVSFNKIVSDTKDRLEIIVSFLALLELVKQKIISVEQKGLFEEIKMKSRA